MKKGEIIKRNIDCDKVLKELQKGNKEVHKSVSKNKEGKSISKGIAKN